MQQEVQRRATSTGAFTQSTPRSATLNIVSSSSSSSSSSSVSSTAHAISGRANAVSGARVAASGGSRPASAAGGGGVRRWEGLGGGGQNQGWNRAQASPLVLQASSSAAFNSAGSSASRPLPSVPKCLPSVPKRHTSALSERETNGSGR